MKLKNNQDLGRLRVHTQSLMQNKLFIGFISVVSISMINIIIHNKNLYKNYSIKELLNILIRQRFHVVKGIDIIYPATKEQSEIYPSF
jgi:predicted nucleic-acid-binding protein